MKNYVQPGVTVTVIAPAGGATAGVGLLVGALFGIAAITAAEGEEVEITTEGVFTHAKTSAQAWAQGALIYWDNAARRMTTAAASGANTLVGVAAQPADNPSDTGTVLLTGQVG